MPIVDLDRQQGFALIAEMTSTRNLLAYGIRVIRTGAFIETTRDLQSDQSERELVELLHTDGEHREDGSDGLRHR